MKEIWKGFPGLESRYLVSNFGKIYSLLYKKLLSTYSQDGYDYVSFVVNRKHTNISVHRAVALTFIPNPEGKEEVVKEWESQISASRALGVSQSGISKCCRGVTTSYHGFVWKFKFPPSANNK